MQDRYAGDVGDFLKLGLLRHLTQSSEGLAPMRLGVVWYLAPNEDHNADGKHISYLDDGSRAAKELRPLDPDLHDRLRSVVENGRSVAALERAGVLPPGNLTFADRLAFEGPSARAAMTRARQRADWVARAAEAVRGADLVFVDPDNGVRRSDHKVPRHRTAAVKHAYYDELAAFADQGQSIVAYHHADRSAPVAVQAERRMADASDELDIEPLAVVRASRGTVRLFLVLAQPSHRVRLEQRLGALVNGPWGRELSVIWGNVTSVERG